MTEARLAPGDLAPDFTLHDQDDNPVTLSSLRGSRVVLYFYPEAMTPGCTTEACDFRDNLNSFASAGVRVLGVSKDDVAKLKAFAERDRLNFTLLSDADLDVQQRYGVWGEKSLYGKIVVGSIRYGGTTLTNYRTVEGLPGRNQQRLEVYGQAGLPCPRCGTELRSRTLDGRTTTWCPSCQPR